MSVTLICLRSRWLGIRIVFATRKYTSRTLEGSQSQRRDSTAPRIRRGTMWVVVDLLDFVMLLLPITGIACRKVRL